MANTDNRYLANCIEEINLDMSEIWLDFDNNSVNPLKADKLKPKSITSVRIEIKDI